MVNSKATSFDDLDMVATPVAASGVPSGDVNLTFDLSEIGNKVHFPVFANGSYPGVVHEVSVGVSAAGNQQIAWTFKAAEPMDDVTGQQTGLLPSFKFYTALTGPFAPNSVATIEACDPKFNLAGITNASLQRLVGRKVVMVLKTKQEQGEPRTSITRIEAVTVSEFA